MAFLLLPLGSSVTTAAGVARFREVDASYMAAPGMDSWRTRVMLQHRAKSIGTGAMACAFVEETSSVRECNGTYTLPEGKIAVQGEIISRAGFVLVVTGGTGAYLGAKGSMVATRIGSNPRQAFITFYFA